MDDKDQVTLTHLEENLEYLNLREAAQEEREKQEIRDRLVAILENDILRPLGIAGTNPALVWEFSPIEDRADGSNREVPRTVKGQLIFTVEEKKIKFSFSGDYLDAQGEFLNLNIRKDQNVLADWEYVSPSTEKESNIREANRISQNPELPWYIQTAGLIRYPASDREIARNFAREIARSLPKGLDRLAGQGVIPLPAGAQDIDSSLINRIFAWVKAQPSSRCFSAEDIAEDLKLDLRNVSSDLHNFNFFPHLERRPLGRNEIIREVLLEGASREKGMVVGTPLLAPREGFGRRPGVLLGNRPTDKEISVESLNQTLIGHNITRTKIIEAIHRGLKGDFDWNITRDLRDLFGLSKNNEKVLQFEFPPSNISGSGDLYINFIGLMTLMVEDQRLEFPTRCVWSEEKGEIVQVLIFDGQKQIIQYSAVDRGAYSSSLMRRPESDSELSQKVLTIVRRRISSARPKLSQVEDTKLGQADNPLDGPEL